MNNELRKIICEMIIKIYGSEEDDSLIQLEMLKDYINGMYDLKNNLEELK